MSLLNAEQFIVGMCCPLCDCLGFCRSSHRATKKIVSQPDDLVAIFFRKDPDEFIASAQAGCPYCSLVVQVYTLLQPREHESRVNARSNSYLPMKIDIRIFNNNPTEIGLNPTGGTRTVQIFAKTGVYNLTCIECVQM